MTDTNADPIHATIADWHRFLRGDLPGGLDELLHEDCVFYSPVVFTPQRGRDITKLYLYAAMNTLAPSPSDGPPSGPTDSAGGAFRYTREVMAGHDAVLEFETEVDGLYANGVDLITCDDEGQIVEFKVMMRPLKALNAVLAAMRAMLEQLDGDSPALASLARADR